MRRRGVGVGAVKKRKDDAKAFSAAGKAMEERHISHVSEVIENFRVSLLEFASKHKDRINADPEFRHKFHVMCSSIGIDPLASNKGFWSDLLGVGDFYYEIGVQVLQIGVQTRALNGGIMPLFDLLERVRSCPGRSGQTISREDIKRAIEKISVLGSGVKLIKVTGRTMVVFVPLEMNTDHRDVLDAAWTEGFVSEEMFVSQYGWTRHRFYGVINVLAQEGIAWVDMHGDSRAEWRYFFPSLWQSHNKGQEEGDFGGAIEDI